MDWMRRVCLVSLFVLLDMVSVGECDRTRLTNRSGIIESPGFPQNYSNSQDILWALSASSPMKYQFKLIALQIEESIGCKNDYLTMRQRYGASASTVKPIVCGSKKQFANKTILWSVVAYEVAVNFNSDRSVTYPGFRLEYEAQDVDTDMICKDMRKGSSSKGTISSDFVADTTRYPANLNCSWNFYKVRGQYIQIKVDRFEIEYFGESCTKDSFSIYGRKSRNDEEDRLGPYCGRREKWTTTLKDYGRVRLTILTDLADNDGGFHIEVSPLLPDTYVAFSDSVLKRITGEKKGSFPIPTAWLSQEQSGAFTWHLRADPGYRIRIRGQASRDFSDKYAYVIIYDGPDDSYVERVRYDPPGFPLDTTSPGFHMVIKLFLKKASQIKKLSFMYKTFNHFLSGKIVKRHLDLGDYTFNNRPDRTFRCCLYYSLRTPYGKGIAFDLFRSTRNVTDCSKAGMVVYDGGFNKSQMIGPVCDPMPNIPSLFRLFVSRFSTIFVFLYDYTNVAEGKGVTDVSDAWTTTCEAYHATEASVRTPAPTPSISHWGVTTRRDELPTLNISVNTRNCFLLFVHPWTDSEPAVHLNVERSDTPSRLCQTRFVKAQLNQQDNQSLPVGVTKYGQGCLVAEDVLNGSVVYRMEGNKDVSWSQRFGTLLAGDINSHLCGKVESCQNGELNLQAPCGIIIHSEGSCVWTTQGPTGTRPYYWALDIVFIDLNLRYAVRNCYLSVTEFIRAGKAKMETRFLCIEMNRGRLRRYRTMELYSPLKIANVLTKSLKIRYAMRYVPVSNDHELASQSSCTGKGVFFQGHCYEFERTFLGLTWLQAEEKCLTKGGHLASIKTVQELQFLKNAFVSHWNDELFQEPLGYVFIGLTDTKQYGVHRWVDGNPVSLTDWFHAWDKDNNIVPFNPRLPLDPLISQPTPDRAKRCVAMAVGNAYYSTNWIKISCSRVFAKSSYICKLPANGEKDDGESNSSTLNNTSRGTQWENGGEHQRSAINNTILELDNNMEPVITESEHVCPQNWTFIKGRCYCLVSEDIPLDKSTPSGKAISLCADIGGVIASVENLSASTLLYHFKLWGLRPGDGDVWTRTGGRQIEYTSVSALEEKVEIEFSGAKAEERVVSEGREGFVLCERQVVRVAKSCLEHHFQCNDGTCLADVRACDGTKDCLAGEDEKGCGEKQEDLFFTCEDNTVISASDVCDFWPDCKDGTDETHCRHISCLPHQFRCRDQKCIPREQKCDFKTHCLDGSDEDDCDWGVDVCKSFECPNGMCISRSRVNDLVDDCSDGSGVDEDSTKHLRLTFYRFDEEHWRSETDNSSWCPGRTLFRRCHRDRVTCMNRAHVCLYDQNEHGDTLYCRDGTHLKDCADYECPGLFKCPNSHCIPWYKVCDGHTDCPGAFDESNCERSVCPGRLRCKGSNQCVTKEQICDGRVHCKGSWSDEQFCDLPSWTCPQGCSCIGYAVNCSSMNLTRVPGDLLSETRVLLLQGNNIILRDTEFHTMNYLVTLRLAMNGISKIPVGSFTSLANLRTLDLRFNSITTLYANMFRGLESLVTLLLDGNPLQVLESRGFLGLESLPLLNLSGLKIHMVETEALIGLPKVDQLDLSDNEITVLEPRFLPPSNHSLLVYLTGNSLDETDAEVFRQVAARKLWTDSFRFCCFVERSLVEECHPSSDAFSSCEDLLSTVMLRAVVWFLGITCIVGNSSVMVWRVYAGLRNRPDVYVLNLSLSDTLMGMYLVILAATDTHYRGNYILHDVEWRRGWVCQLLGMLTTVSCQMSMFTLLVLAWDRFVIVTYPLSAALRTPRLAWILVAGLWLLCIAIALFPTVAPQSLVSLTGKNSICIPFSFSDPKSPGWEYTTVVFVGINGVCLVAMIALYAAIYCHVRDSQMNMGRTDRSDLVVARRLSIVLITNIMSWIPVILANIISLAAGPLTREMSVILTTVILPLNPALNPYLYTFSSCIKRENNKAVKKTALT